MWPLGSHTALRLLYKSSFVPQSSFSLRLLIYTLSIFPYCIELLLSCVLDGTDGKQARRTGSSSPLGELFDHGLDSWCVSMFTLNVYSIYGVDLVPGEYVYGACIFFLLCIWQFCCSAQLPRL